MPTTVKQAAAAQRQANIERDAGISNVSAVNVTPIDTTPAVTPAPVATSPTGPAAPVATEVTPAATGPTVAPQAADAATTTTPPPQEISDVSGLQAFGDTEQGAAMSQSIEQLQAQIASGTLTPEEAKSVQDQANATKAQYDTLISDAQRQKQQGMAKDLVAAGQRGGLMNTQFSGIAALTPTVGGDFVGQGGELYRIQSEYDLNISNLQAQQLQAVANAQDAAKAAIKTGKKEDLDAAVEAFNTVKSLHDERNQLIIDKASALAEYQKSQLELQKYEQETASKTIDAIAQAGYSVEDIPDGYFQNLDLKAGYAIGTSQALFEVAANEKKTTDYKAQVDQAKALTDIFSNLQVGSPPVTIGDSTYSLLNYGDNMSGTETNSTGQYLWTTNNATGETTVRRFGEASNQQYHDFQSDQGPVVRVYADGHKITFDPTQPDLGIPNPQALQATFPDSFKPSDEQLASLGLSQLNPTSGGIQCGQFVRLITGYTGSDLSSSETKRSLIDPSIGTADNPPQAGDAFIQSGGSYDHIGVVLGATALDDGSYQISIVDANSQGDGAVHYRTINSNNVLGFARQGFGLVSDFQFGTDAPSSPAGGLTFGGGSDAVHVLAQQLADGTIDQSALSSSGLSDQQRQAAIVEAANIKNNAPAQTGLVTLSPENQKLLEASPETKKLAAGSDLRSALDNYKDLLDQYGSTQTFGVGPVSVTLQGKQKADLENAYGVITAKYKAAESLGALDEGVTKAVQNIIRDISKTKNIGQFFQPGKIKSQIEQLNTGLNDSALQSYNLLISKNPAFANSEYLQQLLTPYTVRVKDKNTGQTGVIPINEYDETQYDKI